MVPSREPPSTTTSWSYHSGRIAGNITLTPSISFRVKATIDTVISNYLPAIGFSCRFSKAKRDRTDVVRVHFRGFANVDPGRPKYCRVKRRSGEVVLALVMLGTCLPLIRIGLMISTRGMTHNIVVTCENTINR